MPRLVLTRAKVIIKLLRKRVILVRRGDVGLGKGSQGEVGPLVLLFSDALSRVSVVGLGVRELAQGHGNVFLGQLILQLLTFSEIFGN